MRRSANALADRIDGEQIEARRAALRPLIKSTGGSSLRYGRCEVCREHASEVFMAIVGSRYAFGHEDCMRRHGAAVAS